MEGRSHRVGGVLVALGGFLVLRDNGSLIADVHPLLQLSVIYPFSIVGSLLPDQDHHEASAPMKDVVSLAFCKVLHASTNLRKKMVASGISKKSWLYRVLGVFDARHRSWQTHSDLSFLIVCFILWSLQGSLGYTPSGVIIRLISTGLLWGLLSHLVLDMLTPSGIWCLGFKGINTLLGRRFLPEKIRLVPKSSFFSTGGPWEQGWRWGMSVISFLLLFYILFDLLPVRFTLI